MFQFVRRIIAALLNRLRPLNPPEDPYAAVPEPRRRSPSGQSSAVALAEPEARTGVEAVANRLAQVRDARRLRVEREEG
jgi:hypothetical protein